MPWQEVSPGRFERPFDSLESFYRAVKASCAALKREHFLLDAILQISPFPTKDELESMWVQMRWQFPLIAGADEGGKYVYEVPDEAALDAWVERTVHIIKHDDIQNFGNVHRSPEPVTDAHIFAIEETEQLVIRTSHWRMDGMGIILFSNKVLEALANPLARSTLQWSSAQTAPRLTAGLDESLSVPMQDTAERQAKAMRLMTSLAENPSSMVFTTSQAPLPRATNRKFLILSESDTIRIVQGCKARQISMTSGVHAALILAGQKRRHQSRTLYNDQYTYADVATICLRKHISQTPGGYGMPVTLLHTGVPIIVDVLNEGQCRKKGIKRLRGSSLTFSQVASDLSAFYQRDLSAPPSMFDYLRQWVNTIVAAYANPPDAEGPPPPALPVVGDVRNLEHHLSPEYSGTKTFVLEDWDLRVDMLDRHIMAYCWTWRGETTIHCLYNEAFYSASFVDDLVEDWKEIMLKELA